MSISYILKGNIFHSKAQVLVNPVNCVGTMGTGLTLQFRNKFPDMYSDYILICKEKLIRPGHLWLYTKTKPWILNFPTKLHWKDPSRLDYVEDGLNYLLDNYKSLGITSIAIPPLGCGLGRLEWNDVGHLMSIILADADMDIELYPSNS